MSTGKLFTAEEEKTLWDLLDKGEVILFLGAGFSMDARNCFQEPIPGAIGLSKKMNQAITAYGRRGYSDKDVSNLKIVSAGFYNTFKTNVQFINDFFKSNLQVDKKTVPDYYSNLKKLRWNSIYTTNYDNLLEVIYGTEKEGGYKKVAFRRKDSDLQFEGKFNIVYLNGDLNCNARVDEDNNGIITDIQCSIDDFARSGTPPIWTFFINKFRQCPIIIVGSQFKEESFFAEFSRLLQSTNVKRNERPKSYIIIPDEKDEHLSLLEETYNLHHIKGNTKDFLEWIAQIRPEVLPDLKTQNVPVTHKISEITLFNEEFWSNLRGRKTPDELIKYYTNINSSLSILPYVISEDFYVDPGEDIVLKTINEPERTKIDSLLTMSGSSNCLIRINANGGTGKSTFLLHLGKKYCKDFHILYINNISENINLPDFPNDDLPVLVLLDNYGKYLDYIRQFSQSLYDKYYKRCYCLIIAERHIRESFIDSEIRKELDENFNDVYNCTISHKSEFYSRLFEKIILLIDKDNQLDYLQKNESRQIFLNKSKATTAERIIEFLLTVKHSTTNLKFSFDWEDWEKLCKENDDFRKYLDLYTIVAIFNKFDISPPIKYCVDVLKIDDPNLIITYRLFSKANYAFPISIQNDNCFELRNPNLAKWYLREKDNLGILIKRYFKLALSEESSDLMFFRRNTYRNQCFLKDDDLKKLTPDYETFLTILENHIKDNPRDPDNVKNKMEMVIIYLSLDQTEKAKEILYDMISDNIRMEIYARTKLASILIKEKNYEEAKQIVNKLTEIDPTNNYVLDLRISILKYLEAGDEISVMKGLLHDLPKENLSNIQYLLAKLAKALRLDKNYEEAKKYCYMLIELNPLDCNAMNTLAKILKEQGKYEEAEALLIKAIVVQPNSAANYNELAQVYLDMFDSNRNEELKYKALHTFITGLKKDVTNIPLRTSFARFLNTYCKKSYLAKKILIDNILRDPSHYYSYTELGLLLQRNEEYVESKEVLEEGMKHLPVGKIKENIPMLVVLSNTLFELKEYEQAEVLLKKTLAIKPDNSISHIFIAKVFLKLQKFQEFEEEIKIISTIITDVISLSDFANWLKSNNRVNDGLTIIKRAAQVNKNKNNMHVTTIHADLILDRIIELEDDINSLTTLQLVGQCENLCLKNLKLNAKHEQSLHILYKLNLFLRDMSPKKSLRRNEYYRNYKKYLGTLLILNPQNVYVFEAIIQHLRKARKYRLAIAFIKGFKGNTLSKNVALGNLVILYGFLQNKDEIASIKKDDILDEIYIPNYVFNKEIVCQDNIGFYKDGNIFSEGKVYPIYPFDINICSSVEYRSKESTKGCKIFFGLYKVNDGYYADCIEPYFEAYEPDEANIIELYELGSQEKIIQSKRFLQNHKV